MREFDHIVVGGGVVGLACAAKLAKIGSVLLVERHAQPGQEASSRNSGVVHSGLYYPTDSLKARLCTRGRELLYDYCTRHHVPFRKLGKLIVATTPGEEERLGALLQQGKTNGVPGLEILPRSTLSRLEPQLQCHAALYSPETGIVDAHELMRTYKLEATEARAVLCVQTEAISIERSGSGHRTTLRDPSGTHSVESLTVVICAGLCSDQLLERSGIDTKTRQLNQYPCKGQYFALGAKRRNAFSHLVYPLPDGPGLGIHATLQLDGQVLLGPDATYQSEPDINVDPNAQARFLRSAQRFWPSLKSEELSPAYAGVRAKLAGPGEPMRDFVISSLDATAPGMIALLGIESPGLTASLAIAERVGELARSVC